MMAHGDDGVVLAEISSILGVEADPVVLLETVRKLEKVLKAVPRMESFIGGITR